LTIHRRELLSGLAAAAATTLLRSEKAPTQPQQTRKYNKPVIDAHVHWYPPEFADLIEKEGAANGVTGIVRNKNGELECTVPGYHPYAPHASFRRDMTDSNMVIKMMDDRNVDMSVLAQTNPHVLWAPPAFGLKLARAINDSTSNFSVKYPKRILGAITLPWQEPSLALQELDRAAKLPGMRAVNCTENILGKNLSDKEFWPVYERIEALGLPMFMHNVDPISERMMEKDYTMINVLGNPFEATMACTALVLGGVMDAFPKLDVFMPHAGGVFVFLTPRMDWSMGMVEYSPRGRTNSFKNLKLSRASDYRRRFHYDLILHDPKVTRMMIDIVGVDRIACGPTFHRVWAS
jgi:aminocarboxymuconate-semialdehyde decarboxylase